MEPVMEAPRLFHHWGVFFQIFEHNGLDSHLHNGPRDIFNYLNTWDSRLKNSKHKKS
jgi:hypothetical protein